MAAAAAVVSVSMGVMKPVLSKLGTLMGDKYKKIKGLRKVVAFLQRELGDMDALLEKMDSADELDPQAKKWRRDIIEMSYDIEDCIDDFMHTVGEADNNMGILRKAAKYLRTFKDRRRLANDFQEIKTLVIEASDRRKRYMLDQCISVTTSVVVDPRLSALYKESANLVGIQSQKDELVSWAMDEVKQLKFVAIVGFGGIGKTTLANEVYREVEDKFDHKAFISVSQKPQMTVLFNSLISQLGLQTYSHACQLQDPINTLRTHLQNKRYCIIVDDLWDVRAWNTIWCAFPQSCQHSRVVITTRNEDVARACCGNHGFIHTMGPLSEADSRKLFFDRIFGSEDACPSELMKASHEILKKCGGLPLAIITMSSMLSCQPRFEGQWEYIQNSLATTFATNSNYEDMMYILDLSYKNLPRHLKACFLYLGSYPEDHEIDRYQLVRRWVAEGFVSNSDGKDVWDIAESYFNELLNRSMIQPTCMDCTRVYCCKVHDMLLELIARRCKEDNFLSFVNGPKEVIKVQDRVIRRLTVACLRGETGGRVFATIGENTSHIRSLSILKVSATIGENTSHIRSLSILEQSNWMPLMLEFKFLRVLFLDCMNTTMDLTAINQLSQLRYLEIIGKAVLPGQIQGLRHLETLDLTWTSTIPEVVDVPCLSHLAVWQHGRRCLLPDWIGHVKSLRTLRGFRLPMNSTESTIALGELTALSDLDLCSHDQHVPLMKATWMAALSTSLQKLSKLKRLRLRCDNTMTDFALHADLLSSFSPPFCNLERLYLADWTFSRVPRWIGQLHNLHALSLGVERILQEDVAIIGTRLLSLLDLCLRITGVLTESIVIGGSTGFPIIKQFQFDCDEISYLIFETGAMPELQELELVFNPYDWDEAAPHGLQNLPSRAKIKACRADHDVHKHNYGKEELIMGVFDKCPTFILDSGWQLRRTEEEDYFAEES